MSCITILIYFIFNPAPWLKYSCLLEYTIICVDKVEYLIEIMQYPVMPLNSLVVDNAIKHTDVYFAICIKVKTAIFSLHVRLVVT